MAEIRWTIQAADDLEGIVNFISADSEHYARLLAVDILEAVERVGAFPESAVSSQKRTHRKSGRSFSVTIASYTASRRR